MLNSRQSQSQYHVSEMVVNTGDHMLNVVLVEGAEGGDCLSLFTAVRATTTWSLWREGSNDVVSEVRDARSELLHVRELL